MEFVEATAGPGKPGPTILEVKSDRVVWLEMGSNDFLVKVLMSLVAVGHVCSIGNEQRRRVTTRANQSTSGNQPARLTESD